MSQTIYNAMIRQNIVLDPITIHKFIGVVIGWEVRGTHPLALNSQAIGIHPIAFTDNDREALFSTFNVNQKDLKRVVQSIEAINPDFKVVSDPFNILSMWLLHLGFVQIRDHELRESFLMAVSKYLHYRFFTSLINYYYRHGASEKYMTAAINNLSLKFDIVKYGTWKATIEARCADLISPKSIHYGVLETGQDDKAFLKALQDIQTRVRDKVKNITEAYYQARETGDTIGSRSSTAEIDGEKVLVHTAKTLDVMIYNLLNEVMSRRLFVDAQTVRAISNQFQNVSEDFLRNALIAMVDIATDQRDSSQLDLVRENDGREIYIGIRAFITNLIQKSYRYCEHNGVDITNRAKVFVKIKNIYASSRINDNDILSCKESMIYLIDRISTSRRETTKSSLRLAVILYIITRSFRFL